GAAAPSAVADRRRQWEANRRLSPPLQVGRLSPFLSRLFGSALESLRSAPVESAAGMVHGMPASPGRATGRVRLLRDPEDLDRLQPGEVLVTQTTTPAWTPLFARAAAVVTDGGGIAAHASLVAREY